MHTNHLTRGQMSSDTPSSRVFGTNNATYGPIPLADQVFEVEFLEMAPSPLPVYVAVISKAETTLTKGLSDRIFFVLLRGTISSSAETARGTPVDNAELAKATLSFSMACTFPDGTHDLPKSYSIPLRTVKAA